MKIFRFRFKDKDGGISHFCVVSAGLCKGLNAVISAGLPCFDTARCGPEEELSVGRKVSISPID